MLDLPNSTQQSESPEVISTRRILLLILLAALPFAAFGIYSFYVSATSTAKQAEGSRHATAVLAAQLVEAESEYWVRSLELFSKRAALPKAIHSRDEEVLRSHLQTLVEVNPGVDRAFITDPAGLLWSDFPKAPESLGQRFDHREWYQGVSLDWRPYISGVYRRNALPQVLVVAAATPVRDPQTQQVIAIVVAQVQLERLTEALRAANSEEKGHVVVLDHKGILAAHPQVDLQQQEIIDFKQLGGWQSPRAGQSFELQDPFSGMAMLATAAVGRVCGNDWLVLAKQPRDYALRPQRFLIWQATIVFLLLALIAGGMGYLISRSHVRLSAYSRQLAHENAVRRKAEAELRQAHDNLEALVRERTSELRKAEEMLHHAQRMEAVGRLAGGIAHDFNNMLSVIIGYGDIVLHKLPKDSPIRGDIREIRNAGERAGQLTRQLLAFSRKQVLQPEVLNLNDVVFNMERMLRRLIGEDIDLNVHLEPQLKHIKFDPGQIEQIIVNLVVNARDAMPQGGKISIQTANTELEENYAVRHPDSRTGPHVMLAISDTGTGMDAETKARIFEPFFTTKEVGRGTGLGLATVYGIVKQSGGNIWVYSEPGHGTSFKVYLPAETGLSNPAKRRSVVLPAVRGTETVLVVEDEDAVRSLIVRVLNSSGYKVLEAGSAQEAIRIAAEYQGEIHILLTDVVMPGMGGRQLAQTFEQSRARMKVLYMSGYTDNAIVHHGVLDEGAAFLEKPIRPDAMLRKLREVLAGIQN